MSKNYYIYYGLLFLALFPWLLVQWSMSVNGNAAWLMISAERLLAGGSMIDNFYDTNPPLSILYHVPVIWIADLLPLAKHHALFLYFMTLSVFSLWAFHSVLKRWYGLEDQHRAIIMSTYIISLTIMAALSLGEREYVILWGLMPMLFVQLSMTKGYDLPKLLKYSVLILGSIAVLIKPHFGLLPVIILVHRMVTQRRITIFKDVDFLILAVATLSYAGVIYLFFSDYALYILADVLLLYASEPDYVMAMPSLLIYGFFVIIFLIWSLVIPLKSKSVQVLAVWFFVFAGMALIPAAVQMKGFYYHFAPAVSFMFCGMFLYLYTFFEPFVKKVAVLFICGGLAVYLGYWNVPLMWNYPTHDQFIIKSDHLDEDRDMLPLSRDLESCTDPCPYFVFHDNLEIVQPTAFYNENEYASRFPVFWFLPSLVKTKYALENDLPAAMDLDQYIYFEEKYAQIIAMDLNEYRPKRLYIGRYDILGNGSTFDLKDFFKENEEFVKAFASYKKERVFGMNLRHYFRDTPLDFDQVVQYDVYVRDDI